MRLTLFALLLLLAACQQNPASENTQTSATPADTSTQKQVIHGNPWLDAGCQLVTQKEIVEMFSIDVQRDAYNERSLVERGYCLRYWNKPDWAARENASMKGSQAVSSRNSIASQVLDFRTPEMARQQYDNYLKNRGDVYNERVDDLGDGALWSNSTTTLVVWKNHLCFQFTVDMTDEPHDNLEKAKALAILALKKM